MVEIGRARGVGRKSDWALRCHLIPPLPFTPSRASRGAGGQVKAGGLLSSSPNNPQPFFLPCPLKSLPPHYQITSSPLLPYLLLLEWPCMAGLFDYLRLRFSLPSLASLSLGASTETSPHGWPKMENAEQRKMEAPLFYVALDLGAFSPAGS